jgi:hypothetical protein
MSIETSVLIPFEILKICFDIPSANRVHAVDDKVRQFSLKIHTDINQPLGAVHARTFHLAILTHTQIMVEGDELGKAVSLDVVTELGKISSHNPIYLRQVDPSDILRPALVI